MQVTIDAGASDAAVGDDYVVGIGGGMGAVIGRLTDTNNHFILVTLNNTLQLYRRQSGAYALLASQPLPSALVAGSTHRLELRVVGSTLTAWWDSAQQLSVSSTFNQTATRHG